MRTRNAGPVAVGTALVISVGTAVAAVGGVVPLRASVSQQHFAPPVSAAPQTAVPTHPGTVQHLVQPAPDAAAGRRHIWVYRPAVPDSATLPVLYFLHGLPGSADDLADQVDLAHALDQAFMSGALAPFVVAAPDGNSLGANDPEWADSVKGHVKLETFVTGPLIEAVEGANRRDARHRAIAGFSMGGYGAVTLALKHPELFGQVASLAGYFHVDDPSHVFGRRPDLEAANSPDRHAAEFGGLRVFLADGAQDTEPTLKGETRRFAALLATAGHPAAVSLPQGGHTWAFVKAEMPLVEDFLEQGWAPKPAWDHPDL
ncbi:MAG: alpha/beta hydrolase-fold protein [Actinomycetota bacterium]|nr:alpha/beta hydrolase-fold protein [Actinomycetota bacterium]